MEKKEKDKILKKIVKLFSKKRIPPFVTLILTDKKDVFEIRAKGKCLIAGGRIDKPLKTDKDIELFLNWAKREIKSFPYSPEESKQKKEKILKLWRKFKKLG